MSKDNEDVNFAINGLLAQSNTLSLQCLRDPLVQHEFRNQYLYIGKLLQSDYEQGKITKEAVVNYVKKERESLIDQGYELGKYGLGVIAGVAQVSTGYAICASIPLTTVAGVGLCATASVTLSANGLNDIYENSANIMDFLDNEQKISNSGWVRDTYRYASKEMGYSDDEADFVYGLVGLATSAYGFVNVLKAAPYANVPDAKQMQLFKALATDYKKGWRAMSGTAFGFEAVNNANTINGMKKIYDE
ncbi:DUF4225 domain-containing protein [Aliivibrio sifiae]|uniref:DUF4225 domain-containing protein n=1 Tax=Aliivibrio sifiae TaxID=566293 RepID=UPI003D0D08A4